MTEQYFSDGYWHAPPALIATVLVEGWSLLIPAATIRGGSYADTTWAGAYALNVQHGPPDSQPWLGFRCCAGGR